MFHKNMRKYNCKVYNICVILYPNDQGREIIYLIESNASFFSRKYSFCDFSLSDSEIHKYFKKHITKIPIYVK